MKYLPPFDKAGEVDAHYQNANPSMGVRGSILDIIAIEEMQREMQQCVTDFGLVPSHDDLTQLWQATRKLYGTDHGTKNAIQVTLSPAPPLLSPGLTVRVKKISTANDGPTTLDIGLGANWVKRATGADLQSGDLPGSTVAEFVWDGSVWQILNFQGFNATSTTINNYTITTPYAVDTGSTNAVNAQFSPAITSLSAGLQVLVKLTHDITSASTIIVNAISAKTIVRVDGTPTQYRDGVNGQIALLIFDGTNFQFANRVGAASGGAGGLAGQCLNLNGSAAGNTKTGAWTVDELIAEDSLGGTVFKGAALTLNFNGATVGAGGMDIGSMPTSNDISIYAIYNPTTFTWNTLGCAGSSSRGACYNGGHFPSGFTGSALIYTGKCDASSNLLRFMQRDHHVEIENQLALSNGYSPYTWQLLSLASIVPVGAKKIGGIGFCGYTYNVAIYLASSISASGFDANPGAAGATGFYYTGLSNSAFAIPYTDIIVVNQQIYWASNHVGSVSLYISRYDF